MRSSLKTTLISLAILGSFSYTSKVYAGDLPGKRAPVSSFATPSYGANWSGLYVGGTLGYGWGRANAANISGFLGGVQAGYNHQFDRVVVGLEGDINYSGVDFRGFTDTFRQKWLMSARLRAGYAFDRFLPYVTGGLAYSTASLKTATGKDTAGHVGWVIGLGTEAMLTDKISARVEFLHYRFGAESYAIPPAARSTSMTTNALRFGINYRF